MLYPEHVPMGLNFLSKNEFGSLLSKIGFFFGQHIAGESDEASFCGYTQSSKSLYLWLKRAFRSLKLHPSTFAVFGQHLYLKTTSIPVGKWH
jgi:hypothetical protein